MEKQVNIKGMTCTACAVAIENSVGKLKGVTEVGVNFATEKMSIDFNETTVSMQDIYSVIRKTGYDVDELSGETKTSASKDNIKVHEESMKKRFIISMIFTIPVFYLAMGEMIGLPIPGFLSGTSNSLILALVQMLLTIPVLIAGKEFYAVGFKTLWKRSPNMDSLIAIGSSAAFIFGVFVVFQLAYGFSQNNQILIEKYSGHLYFESAAVILTLITLGKFLESRAKGKTSDAIKKLLNLVPEEAIVIKDGKEVKVPLKNLIQGDLAAVKPGGKIPADGVIESGYSAVDESMLTGESIPIDKKTGDLVTGGSINKTGYIRFRVTRTGENTTLAQIVKLVENAQSKKAPIARTADRISLYFVPVVIVISILSFVVWMIAGQGFAFSFTIAVSVLVISCPCALGLATPTAIMVGTGKGAGYGILIKSGEALETMHKANTIVFDKTGTITEGKPAVSDILAVGISKERFLELAASAEKMSEHPLSVAIVKEAEKKEIEIRPANNFSAVPGFGIKAQIEDKEFIIGKKQFMTDERISIDESVIKGFSAEGKTQVFAAYNGEFVGIIAIADKIKHDSQSAVRRLMTLGYEVILLTGDNFDTAKAIGAQAGISNVISNVLPEDKAENIKRLQKSGKKVIMVGDGINDAVALVQADVGIAMGRGTDVAIESADVVLMKDSIGDVATALELSKRTIKNIKQNLFWAFFYNVLGIPIAAGVLYISIGLKLNPMIAAAAMSFSSVSVVLNALRLKGFRPTSDGKTPSKKADVEVEQIKKTNRGEKNMKKTMLIEGMTCMHCVARVKESLESLDGVVSAEVSLENKSALVSMTKEVRDRKLINAVKNAGYEATEIF